MTTQGWGLWQGAMTWTLGQEHAICTALHVGAYVELHSLGGAWEDHSPLHSCTVGCPLSTILSEGSGCSLQCAGPAPWATVERKAGPWLIPPQVNCSLKRARNCSSTWGLVKCRGILATLCFPHSHPDKHLSTRGCEVGGAEPLCLWYITWGSPLCSWRKWKGE